MPKADPLIERLRQQDFTALGEYLESCRPQLLGYIDRQLGGLLRQRIEPQDIFQELASSAIAALPNTDFERIPPFAWLCKLARERIIDASRHFTSEKRNPSHEQAAPVGQDGPGGWDEILAASITSPSQALVRGERQDQLSAAIAGLSILDRELIRLRFVEDLPTKQIAERLGKTDGAIRVQLTRIMDRLRNLIDPDAAP